MVKSYKNLDRYYYLAIFSAVIFIFRKHIFELTDFSIQNEDNLHVIFPIFSNFIDQIKNHGTIFSFNENIFGGMRVIGHPNIPMNPLLYMFFYLSKENFVLAMNYHLIFEILLSVLGFYCLFAELFKNKLFSLLGSLSFLCSASLFHTISYYSTFFHFVVIGNVLYILLTLKSRKMVINYMLIVGLLYYQITYGQIQFTIYTFYFLILFIFYLFREKYELSKVAWVLLSSYFIAALLASHFILPLLDYLYTFKTRSGNLYHYALDKRVRFFYLFNIFAPEVLSRTSIGWWPVWRDGSSYWESYNVYTGFLFSALFFMPNRKNKYCRRLNIASVILVLICSFQVVGLLFVIATGAKGVPYARISHLLTIIIILGGILKLIDIQRNPDVAKKGALTFFILTLFLGLFQIKEIAYNFMNFVCKSLMSNESAAIDFVSRNFNKYYVQLKSDLFERMFYYLIIALVFLVISKIKNLNKIKTFIIFTLLCFNFYNTYQTCSYFGYNDSYPYLKTFKTNPVIDYISKNTKGHEFTHFSVQRKRKDNQYPNMSAFFNIKSTSGYLSSSQRKSLFFEDKGFNRANTYPTYKLNYIYRESIKYYVHQESLAYHPDGSISKEYQIYLNTLDKLEKVFTWKDYSIYEMKKVLPLYFIPNKIDFYRDIMELGKYFLDEDDLTLDFLDKSYVKENNVLSFNNNLEGVDVKSIINHNFNYSFFIRNNNQNNSLIVFNIPRSKLLKFKLNGKKVSPVLVNSKHYGIIVPKGESKIQTEIFHLSLYLGIFVSLLTFFGIVFFLIYKNIRINKKESIINVT